MTGKMPNTSIFGVVLTIVVIGALAAAISACGDGSYFIITTGTIEYRHVEGGCWVIVAENGRTYEPVNISDEYKKDGLVVEFRARLRSDLSSVCMSGEIMEIEEINTAGGK